jgi:hypothetical protein
MQVWGLGTGRPGNITRCFSAAGMCLRVPACGSDLEIRRGPSNFDESSRLPRAPAMSLQIHLELAARACSPCITQSLSQAHPPGCGGFPHSSSRRFWNEIKDGTTPSLAALRAYYTVLGRCCRCTESREVFTATGSRSIPPILLPKASDIKPRHVWRFARAGLGLQEPQLGCI